MRNNIPDLDLDELEAVDLPEGNVLLASDNDKNGDYCEVATQEDMDNW